MEVYQRGDINVFRMVEDEYRDGWCNRIQEQFRGASKAKQIVKHIKRE